MSGLIYNNFLSGLYGTAASGIGAGIAKFAGADLKIAGISALASFAIGVAAAKKAEAIAYKRWVKDNDPESSWMDYMPKWAQSCMVVAIPVSSITIMFGVTAIGGTRPLAEPKFDQTPIPRVEPSTPPKCATYGQNGKFKTVICPPQKPKGP